MVLSVAVNSKFSYRPLPRSVALCVLAFVELTWLTIRVEVPATGFLSVFKGFPSIFITSVAIVCTLLWALSRRKIWNIPTILGTSHNPWPMLFFHWVAFVLFAWLSILITETSTITSDSAISLNTAWICTGLTVGAFFMLAVFPIRAWIGLFRQNSGIVFMSAVIVAFSWTLGFLANRAWESLLEPTFKVVEWLLSAFGEEVVSQPEHLLLGTTRFKVKIFHACAGYEGIGLIAVFIGSYLWLFRKDLRFPESLILLPCGICAIWLFNAIRITLLILVGTYISPELAVDGFHSAAGWVAFLAVALTIVNLTQKCSFFAAIRSQTDNKSVESGHTACYLAPMMTLLAAILVTRIFLSGQFDWLYPVRVISTAAVIWFFWREKTFRIHFGDVVSWGAIVVGVGVYVMWVGLERGIGNVGYAKVPAPLTVMPIGIAAVWVTLRVVGSAVIVPIAEELAFRGYLLRRLISCDFEKITPRFTWLSFLLSSVLFGVLHGRWLAGALAGMCYAFAMYRRGRVSDAVVAHATTNALIAADVLMLGNWNYWS